MSQGWIAVDLDGTLAHYDDWRGHEHIGRPIQPMVDRVCRWLAAGQDVRIFTARVRGEPRAAQQALVIVEQWSKDVFGRILPVTCKKDYGMIELWDDRCVQVEPNTGRRMDGQSDEDFVT